MTNRIGYVVELRDNDYGSSDEDPVVGYLGLVRGEAYGAVSNLRAATIYDKPTNPNYDLNRLSDEFFARYLTKVVPYPA